MVRGKRKSKSLLFGKRKNHAVSAVIGEVIMIALVVAFAATISTVIYVWASGNWSHPTYIPCKYDPLFEKFTVIKSPDVEITWDECIVTIYNETNKTVSTVNIGRSDTISAGDTIDVSNYVSSGNSYILTIVAKNPSVVLYIYSWHQ